MRLKHVLLVALGLFAADESERWWNPFGCVCSEGHRWVWECTTHGHGDDRPDDENPGGPYPPEGPPWAEDTDGQGGGGECCPPEGE